MAGLPRLIDVDAAGETVTVSAGLTYGEVAVVLHRAGRALPNLASLPHISVAGACATGTHGSGDGNGNLASAVSAVEMVTADGDLVTVSRDADPGRFPGTVVGLGALGIVTRLTLDTVPAFDVRQYVYEDLPDEQVTEHFDEIMASAYSVSLFTDWRAPGIRQAWLKRRADAPDSWTAGPRWMGGRLADGPRHPVPGMSPAACTEQLGRARALARAAAALPAGVHPQRRRRAAVRVPAAPCARHRRAGRAAAGRRPARPGASGSREIRTIAADELWLSPAYQRDAVAFHFTWIKDWAAVEPVLALVEERLAPLRARPHWGKLFGTSPESRARAVPAAGRLPAPDAPLRPRRQVPQRPAGPLFPP